MRVVVITEAALDRLFAATLEQLELEKLRAQSRGGDAVNWAAIADVHRAFRHQVGRLKESLRDD